MAKIDIKNGSAPSTPSSGVTSIYAKTDKKLYIKDDTGLETDLTAAGSSAVWGGITGTLSSQTDLQSALNAKENTGVAASLVSSHEAALDPHTQYTTTAEAQAIADAKVDDTAYNASSWNGITNVAPSKNSVRDELENLRNTIAELNDLVTYTQFGGL